MFSIRSLMPDAAFVPRWVKREGLIDWFLGASDAALDTMEDVVRRLSSK